MSAGPMPTFLTQAEVGKILRRSVQSVARLRRIGELAWLPGSPILIPESEVQAYLDRKLVRREAVAWAEAKRREGPSPEERAAQMIAKLKRSGQWDSFAKAAARQRELQRTAKK